MEEGEREAGKDDSEVLRLGQGPLALGVGVFRESVREGKEGAVCVEAMVSESYKAGHAGGWAALKTKRVRTAQNRGTCHPSPRSRPGCRVESGIGVWGRASLCEWPLLSGEFDEIDLRVPAETGRLRWSR